MPGTDNAYSRRMVAALNEYASAGGKCHVRRSDSGWVVTVAEPALIHAILAESGGDSLARVGPDARKRLDDGPPVRVIDDWRSLAVRVELTGAQAEAARRRSRFLIWRVRLSRAQRSGMVDERS